MKEPISLFEKLPSHVMRQVLDEVTLTDVISLSLSAGKKLVNAIKEAKVPVTTFHLSFCTLEMSIIFENKISGSKWNLNAKDPTKLSTEKCRIGNDDVPVTFTEDNIHTQHDDMVESMHMVLDHLLQLFHGPNPVIEYLEVDLAVVKNPLAAMSRLRHFREVTLLGFGDYDCESNAETHKRFWSQLPQILRVLQDIKCVDISSVSNSPSTLIPELMEIDRVTVSDSWPFYKEMVGQFAMKCATLNSTSMTAQDIADLVKMYLESRSDRMQWLLIDSRLDANVVARCVLEALPIECYSLLECVPSRRSSISTEHPVPLHLYRANFDCIRITRHDGDAIDVFFDGRGVFISKSWPDERSEEPPNPMFDVAWRVMRGESRPEDGQRIAEDWPRFWYNWYRIAESLAAVRFGQPAVNA